MGVRKRALVFGRVFTRAMYLDLRPRHLIHEALLIDEVLLIERVPTRLGDHSQAMFVRFSHDGRRVPVSTKYAVPLPMPGTKNGVDVRLGQKRDEGVPLASGYVPRFVEVVGRKGDTSDVETRFHTSVRL